MGFPEITTDGGRKCIIYSTNAGGMRPIHGAVYLNETWGWIPYAWDKEGYKIRAGLKSDLDIKQAVDGGKIKI